MIVTLQIIITRHNLEISSIPKNSGLIMNLPKVNDKAQSFLITYSNLMAASSDNYIALI